MCSALARKIKGQGNLANFKGTKCEGALRPSQGRGQTPFPNKKLFENKA